MKGSSSMNSTEQKCFFCRICNCSLMLIALDWPGKFTGRYTHGPGIPGICPKRHNIPDMRGILCSSSQIGSSILVLLSCKICHFWKAKYYYWLHDRERGKRGCSFTDQLMDSWINWMFICQQLVHEQSGMQQAASEETSLS